MSNEKMFETASRRKLRFESPKGMLTVDDLWDLPLSANTQKANLYTIANELYRALKAASQESFINTVRSAGDGLQLKFDIAKYIYDTKQEEQRIARDSEERAEKKQKIMAIIARKQDGVLESASLDDLLEMAKNL